MPTKLLLEICGEHEFWTTWTDRCSYSWKRYQSRSACSRTTPHSPLTLSRRPAWKRKGRTCSEKVWCRFAAKVCWRQYSATTSRNLPVCIEDIGQYRLGVGEKKLTSRLTFGASAKTWSKAEMGARNIIASMLSKYGTQAAISVVRTRTALGKSLEK